MEKHEQMIETLLALDEKYFLQLNHAGIAFFDPIMLFITHKFSWIPFYAFLVYLIFKQKGKEGFWILLSIIALITLADQGSVQLFKNVFERLRPCHALDTVRLVGDRCGGQFGFISSHASNTFALAVFLGNILQKKTLFFGLFIWAALVAYSRIYVGVHYPLDILGGMLWGTFVALVVFNIYSLIREKVIR